MLLAGVVVCVARIAPRLIDKVSELVANHCFKYEVSSA